MKYWIQTACCALCFLAFAALIVPCTHAGPSSPEPSQVSIDFTDVDISVFIKFISNITGQNFVVDPRVKGKVTIISPEKISVADARKVFESVLELNGFTTVPAGKIVKIIPTPNARGGNIDTRVVQQPLQKEAERDNLVTRIVPLGYASSDGLKNLFVPLVPRGSVVMSYRDSNMLIITAPLSSINRLLKIVEALDVPSIGRKVSVIPLMYADASKTVQNLNAVFSARSRMGKSSRGSRDGVTFVADERTNSLILLAGKAQTEQVEELVRLLDRKVPKGEEKIRVYYLEHAIAEDLVAVLTQIPVEKASRSGAKKKSPVVSSGVKIMADKATNSLVIMADKEDYPILEEVIEKLDIPRAMVQIECLIMEVNISKGLTVGTEWQAATDRDSGTRAIAGGFGGNTNGGAANLAGLEKGSMPGGFSLGTIGKTFNIGGVAFPDINAIVSAYQSDKDVHIISNPQVTIMENEEVVFTVGKNVPYQTRSAAESGSETYSSYEYKDVGMNLKITPHISKDRLVRLKVYQELTKLDNVNQTNPNRPTTLKRQIETTIVVADGNSVVIGGLIDESQSSTQFQTPCLGSLPLLGWAFKSVGEGKEKTNLYVFLTPRVVKTPSEVRKLYEEKKTEAQGLEKGEVLLYDRLNHPFSSGKDRKTSAVHAADHD